MNFSSENIKLITSHDSIVNNIYHFPNNDSDHFISISKDSELREWVISDEIQGTIRYIINMNSKFIILKIIKKVYNTF
jgi:hypothetical protein